MRTQKILVALALALGLLGGAALTTSCNLLPGGQQQVKKNGKKPAVVKKKKEVVKKKKEKKRTYVRKPAPRKAAKPAPAPEPQIVRVETTSRVVLDANVNLFVRDTDGRVVASASTVGATASH